MAIIILTDTPFGRSVYAHGAKGKRLLIGYVDAAGVFMTGRSEHAALHKQRWGESIRREIESHWIGRSLDDAS